MANAEELCHSNQPMEGAARHAAPLTVPGGRCLLLRSRPSMLWFGCTQAAVSVCFIHHFEQLRVKKIIRIFACVRRVAAVFLFSGASSGGGVVRQPCCLWSFAERESTLLFPPVLFLLLLSHILTSTVFLQNVKTSEVSALNLSSALPSFITTPRWQASRITCTPRARRALYEPRMRLFHERIMVICA